MFLLRSSWRQISCGQSGRAEADLVLNETRYQKKRKSVSLCVADLSSLSVTRKHVKLWKAIKAAAQETREESLVIVAALTGADS